MSALADRPLSLARLRALPAGAVIVDRHGVRWTRFLNRKHEPGWFRSNQVHDWAPDGSVASYRLLHEQYRPLHLVSVPEVTP